MTGAWCLATPTPKRRQRVTQTVRDPVDGHLHLFHQCSFSSQSETDVPPPSSLPTQLPLNNPKRPGASQPLDVSSDSLLNLMTEMMSSRSISDDDANKTLVADEPGLSTGRPVRKTKMRTDKVCHPAGFKELQPKSKPGTNPKGKK